MILRVLDNENEALNSVIDSDEMCFPPKMSRILKMIPVFNIIYEFWSKNNIQLDTVFNSLVRCDQLLAMIQNLENQEKRHIYASYLNFCEEVQVLPLIPLKEMLVLFKNYMAEAEIKLEDRDLACIKEYFYEFVRRNYFIEKNGRFNTVFFYENLEVANMSMKDFGRKSVKFCEVEIVETRSMDRYDRHWLTDIKPNSIFKECLDAAKNYWSGEMTKHPDVEYLFSGKYVLKELK